MVKYCRKCDTATPDENEFCGKCGGQDFLCPEEQSTKPSRVVYVPSDHGWTKTSAVVVAVMLIVTAGLGLFAVNLVNSAHVSWYVHSTHFAYDVDIVVYINGKQVGTFEDLKPGYYYYPSRYYDYSFPIWDDSAVIEIKAVSYGGGLGSQTDTKTIVVHHNGKYSVDLYV